MIVSDLQRFAYNETLLGLVLVQADQLATVTNSDHENYQEHCKCALKKNL